MRVRAIVCDVFFREFSYCAATSPTVVDAVFLRKGLHEKPSELREILQKEIDAIPSGDYDAIVMFYGLCGKAIDGLIARETPIVVPKSHDCIGIFMGSCSEYLKVFKEHPGTYYYTSGAWERGGSLGAEVAGESGAQEAKLREYTEKYGEENAKYLLEMQSNWTAHYTRAAYFTFPGIPFPQYEDSTRKVAEERGLAYCEIPGDYALIRGLLEGPWGDGFLTVNPGERITATDDQRIIAASIG